MQATAILKTTPLFQEHLNSGAQMGPFAGWNMPIQYGGIVAEACHTRRAVSCFDTCHMGEFLIRGDYKRSGLDHLVSARLSDLAIGSCRYSPMLNAEAGVIDDLIVYRRAPEEWMIVVNAATIEKDKRQFLAHLSKEADFKDLSESLGKIDLQGPLASDILRRMTGRSLPLDYYTFTETDIVGEKNIVSRTGYTGELGFEIYASPEKIREVWRMLLSDERVRPAGLGSRDVLRLEMGYSLYGQDMDETITPLEAGLEKFVDLNKDFVGRDALLKQKRSGLKRRRVFLESLSRRSPRHLHKIYSDGNEVGLVTSGTFSPHLEKGIGMGFSSIPLETNKKILVGDGALKIEAVISEKPFVKNTSLKS
jgi:aminomethyltransferase